MAPHQWALETARAKPHKTRGNQSPALPSLISLCLVIKACRLGSRLQDPLRQSTAGGPCGAVTGTTPPPAPASPGWAGLWGHAGKGSHTPMAWGGGSDPGCLLLIFLVFVLVFVIMSPASCGHAGLCQDGSPPRFRGSILSPLVHRPLLVSALTHVSSKLSCVSATSSSRRGENDPDRGHLGAGRGPPPPEPGEPSTPLASAFSGAGGG